MKSFIEKYPQGAGIPYKDLIVASSVTPHARTRVTQEVRGTLETSSLVFILLEGKTSSVKTVKEEGRLSWLTAFTPERVEWISSIVGRGAADVPVINDEAESQWNLSSYLLLSSSWR